MSIDRKRLAREPDSRWSLSGAEEDPGKGKQQKQQKLIEQQGKQKKQQKLIEQQQGEKQQKHDMDARFKLIQGKLQKQQQYQDQQQQRLVDPRISSTSILLVEFS